MRCSGLRELGDGVRDRERALEGEREAARMENLLAGQTGARVERVGSRGERVISAGRARGVERTRGGNSGDGFDGN